MKLELNFNRNKTQVTYSLKGDGAYIVDIIGGKHPQKVLQEVSALILDYTPKTIAFKNDINFDLINHLQIKGVLVNTVTEQVTYLH